MASDEKVRTSGEITRADTSAPVLPTVNPTAEKSEPAKPTFPPAVYIMYGTRVVTQPLGGRNPHRRKADYLAEYGLP